MTQLSIIVAMDRQHGIGIANALPWRLPEDLAHFKRVTTGHPIIMGRKTFESIGRPLPGRRNIVISRNPAWRHDGVETAASIPAALALLCEPQAFIIGGAEIYRQALELADRLIVTEIDHSYACDAFFPPIDPLQWEQTERVAHTSADGLAYAFVTLQSKRAGPLIFLTQ
jgi:dihydrofolate reductase